MEAVPYGYDDCSDVQRWCRKHSQAFFAVGTMLMLIYMVGVLWGIAPPSSNRGAFAPAAICSYIALPCLSVVFMAPKSKWVWRRNMTLSFIGVSFAILLIVIRFGA